MAGVNCETQLNQAEDALAQARFSFGECEALFRAILNRVEGDNDRMKADVQALSELGFRSAREGYTAADYVPRRDDPLAPSEPRQNALSRGDGVATDTSLASARADLVAAAATFNRIERLAEIGGDDLAQVADPRLVAQLEAIRDQAIDGATQAAKSLDREPTSAQAE